MMNKALSILFSVVVCAALLVSGCRLIKPTSTGQPAQQGGTLNLFGTDPTTLDPAVTAEAGSIEFILQVFGGLVRLDDDLKPSADIAERWDLSGDGRTYTFHLRDNARFHTGRPVKAQDFKYSWERAATPQTGSSTAGTYLGDIVGVKEMLSGQSREISGIRVIDDATLEVTIVAPKSYFLYKLTYPVAFVVDSENVRSGGEWWRKPNGTGPFKLKEWVETSRLVLERNSQYHGKVANLGSVVFQMLTGLPMNLYETGQIDVAGVGLPYIDAASDPAGPFLDELVIVPELSFFYIGFNSNEPPFDDVNIRRAFSMAIDKDKLAGLVFRGTVSKADGIVPPGINGFNEDLTGIGFDVAKARDLVRQSAYGDVSRLPQITITTGGEGGAVSGLLQAILSEWRENLGVEVKVRQLQPERYFYFLKEEKDQMFDLGWIADYPHQQDFLEVLFRTGVDINYGEYSNPEVDALLDRAGVEPDADESIALYRQAEQKLVDDAACLPLTFGRNYYLVKPYVKGYQVSPLGFAMLNEVSIER